MQLVELLEVPQLVDACARNGFHEEALELANFVNGLERRHLLAAEVRSTDGTARGGSGVVQSIVDDVHTTLLSLRQQLLHLLTEQASLPKELQILATLRKLDGILIDRQLALERHENDVLAKMTDKQRERLRQHLLQCSETRLQMDFLEARSVWLERVADRAIHGLSGESVSVLAGIEESQEKTLSVTGGSLGPYGRALEMLEVNRTTWFSVITQFKALFEENSEIELCSHPPTAILGAWATRQVHQLLDDLKQVLPSIEEGASLRAILEQTCFFASRMGQVGCDFSSLALPLFRQALINRLTGDWKTANAHFKSMLATERFIVEIDDVAREQVIPLYLKQDSTSAEEITTPMKRMNDDVPAPPAVMAYPPLAYLLNSILTGLNFLRECPLLSAVDVLLSDLVDVLLDACVYFVGLSSDIRTRGAKYIPVLGAKRGLESSVSVLSMDKQYASMLAQEVLPHALSCFDHIFLLNKGGRVGGIATDETPLKKGKGKNVSLRVEQLSSAKDTLNVNSYSALCEVWAIFRKADLLPAEVNITPTPTPPHFQKIRPSPSVEVKPIPVNLIAVNPIPVNPNPGNSIPGDDMLNTPSKVSFENSTDIRSTDLPEKEDQEVSHNMLKNEEKINNINIDNNTMDHAKTLATDLETRGNPGVGGRGSEKVFHEEIYKNDSDDIGNFEKPTKNSHED
jgi:hypothetical protein